MKPRSPGIFINVSSVLLLLLFTAMCCEAAYGQGVRIAKVEYQGNAASQVNIKVRTPGKDTQEVQVRVADQFPPGTIFIIPVSTVVWLQSSNNNTQRLGPGSKHQASPGPDGEKHQTFYGKVTHYVTSKLRFYWATGSNPDIQGAVEGTEFTVTSEGKNVRFATNEGKVAVQKKVAVKISQQPERISTNVARDHSISQITYVSAGDEEASFLYDDSEAINYATYQEAIAAYEYALNQAYEEGVDAELLVSDYANLGELYLEEGNAEYALRPLETALDLIDEIDQDEFNPLEADVYLKTSEAYYSLSIESIAEDYRQKAIEILETEIEFYADDFLYFVDETDEDTAWGIGVLLMELYENLGWAYELPWFYGFDTEEDGRAAASYDMARELEEILDSY